MEIVILPLLKDNYAYLLRDVSGATGVVDPSEAAPVLATLQERGWQLTHIFNTHHHGDHTAGNRGLKSATGAQLVGYAGDAHRIEGMDIRLEDGGIYAFGQTQMQVMHIPGHTLGHIAYYIEQEKALFCGDTLFSLGCGRLFEGTAEQMHHSLCRLAALPEDTKIYCGHEYTETNSRFALTIEPENVDLLRRADEVKRLRSRFFPSIPAIMGEEIKTNPFLRTHSKEIRKYFGLLHEKNSEVFAAIRKAKDDF